MRTVTRVTTPDEFEALACEWESLLTAAQTENIFLTHAWLREWWRVFGRGRELWTLVARGPMGIEGIAPLVLEHGPYGVRRVVFMGANEVQPDHLDLILRPDKRADVTHDFCSYLWQAKTEWDILDLGGLTAESPTLGLLVDYLRTRGLRVESGCSSRSPYVFLSESSEDYWKSHRPSRHGAPSRVPYMLRRLRRDYPTIRFARAQTAEEVETVFDALVRMHQSRWTALGFRGTFANPAVVDFHRAVAREAFAHGHLRLYFMEVDGVAAAVQYGYRIGSGVCDYASGFDEQLARYSAGYLLRIHAMEQSFAEGVRVYDFLQGEEAYKLDLATGVRESWRVRAASPHPRGRLAWMKMHVGDQLSAWVVRCIPRTTRLRMKGIFRLK